MKDVGQRGVLDVKRFMKILMLLFCSSSFFTCFFALISLGSAKVHSAGTLLDIDVHDFMVVSDPLGGGLGPALQNMFSGHDHLPTNSIGPFSFSWLCQDGKMFVKHHEKPKRRLIAS